ncbi:MAG: hypothetical protein IT443_06585 [Phycisphaeraceae bacterium]|nr:hypothetical protein [Phycisphaeraceae bacterium]
MKLLPLTLIACLTFTVLGGCATGPTASQLANADYGTPITESAAKAKAEAWMRGILKDPESASFEWASFKQGWAAEGLFYGGGYLYGYLLDGWVNARNSFGGYTGRKRYVFMFHNGEIAAVWGETEGTSGGFMSRLK